MTLNKKLLEKQRVQNRFSNWQHQFCPSVSFTVCQFVSYSGEKCVNLNTDRVKLFPKLTVSLIL